MAGKKAQHVIPSGDKWTVRRTGSTRASGIFSAQREALGRAKELARNEGGEKIYVHGRDGRIHDRMELSSRKA